jgi:gluconolactonase
MLAAAVATTVFASAAFAADIKVINEKAAFPEGPVFVDGKLHYAEYGGNVINVWDGSTTTKLVDMPGCGPSGIMPLGDDLAVTCYDKGTVERISKDGKPVATYDKASDGGPLVGPNDFASDGKGGLYFTASGPWESGPIVGKVFHLGADGAIVERADDLHYANGLVLSADGSRLYVNESEAGRVISFAVGADGSLSDRRLFARIFQVDAASGASAYPDGLKLGPDGNLYVAQYSTGRIVVLAPDATFVRDYEVPSATAPNLAFSPDGKTMYVTAVDDTANAPYWGKVYEVPME